MTVESIIRSCIYNCCWTQMLARHVKIMLCFEQTIFQDLADTIFHSYSRGTVVRFNTNEWLDFWVCGIFPLIIQNKLLILILGSIATFVSIVQENTMCIEYVPRSLGQTNIEYSFEFLWGTISPWSDPIWRRPWFPIAYQPIGTRAWDSRKNCERRDTIPWEWYLSPTECLKHC